MKFGQLILRKVIQIVATYEMSHFKAENAPNSISLTALPQTF